MPSGEQRAAWRKRLLDNRRSMWRALNGVLERETVYPELGRIRAPTLIAVGAEDVATPRARSERIHAAVAGSRLEVIPGAGHTSTVEEPEAVTKLLLEHLSRARVG
jgi:3-oxoadipate enol-lactonase